MNKINLRHLREKKARINNFPSNIEILNIGTSEHRNIGTSEHRNIGTIISNYVENSPLKYISTLNFLL